MLLKTVQRTFEKGTARYRKDIKRKYNFSKNTINRKEIPSYIYLFIYLFIITGQAAFPMCPEGEQHPKRDHTYINQLYTAKHYNKWLVKISMFSDSMMVTGKLFQSLIVFGKKEF